MEHLADLLDARIGVGRGALAFFDNAKHDLELFYTDVSASDQAPVCRAGPIGRMNRRYVRLSDEVPRACMLVYAVSCSVRYSSVLSHPFAGANTPSRVST